MMAYGLLQIGLFLAVLLLLVRPLGAYMARVYQGEGTLLQPVLGPVERLLYRLCGISAGQELGWRDYALALLAFNLAGLLVVYALLRLQALLPLNPQELAAVPPHLAWNTAVSFATNTNWQSYGGETTLSALTQMAALTVQNFVSSATGMAVLVALIRGLVRHESRTLGSFWVDMARSVLYILLPLSLVWALVLVSQGVVQTLAASQVVPLLQPVTGADGQTVAQQVVAVGPAAAQIAIKQLGTNGGGFFNANSAHPLENPTALSNFVELLAILLIPAALTYTFGRMAGDTRQGWVLLAVMVIIFLALLAVAVWAEQQGNPALAAVVVAAIFLGRGPAVLVSILSVLAFDLFYVEPKGTFAVGDTQYILTFIGLLVVGVVISALTTEARQQAEAARRRQTETVELYELSRDLAATFGRDEILRVVVQHVEHTFGREVVVLLPEEDQAERLAVAAASASLELPENELAVAGWVYRHGEPAGRNTTTLPAASLRYLPLLTARGVVGVLGVVGPDSDEEHLTSEQRRLMDAFASQAAQAMERANLAEQARQAEVLQVTEKLQTALLNSVSHELRTPLVSITGALSTLLDDDGLLDRAAERSLVENAYEEANRLNRLVSNLLDLTRLEAGALTIRREPSDLQDVIGAALQQVGGRLQEREVHVVVPPGLPLVPLDFVPMVQVLVNLVDNALRYSPPDQPIDVVVRAAGPMIEVEVSDRGPGIPAEYLEHIFDRFYLLQRSQRSGGTGLGLSICRGIVEAHGGTIRAQNRPGGGTSFVIALPQGGEVGHG